MINCLPDKLTTDIMIKWLSNYLINKLGKQELAPQNQTPVY